MRGKRVSLRGKSAHAGASRCPSAHPRLLRARLPAALTTLLVGLAGPGPAAASATGVAELQADFSHQLALAGTRSSAYVYDLTAKATLFSERATVPRRPASVEKLFTASAALAS